MTSRQASAATRIGRRLVAISAITALVALIAPASATAAQFSPSAASAVKTSGKTVKARAAVKTSAKQSAPSAAQSARIAADYSSILSGQGNAAGAGWSTCPAPITWTVDTSGLSAEQASRAIADIAWAFDRWSQASGLAFQFAGTSSLKYNDADFTLDPSSGAQAQRSINLAFIDQAPRLNAGVIGLGSPSSVSPNGSEILTGTAIFKTSYVTKASTAEDRALYEHELGHVLGLAHAADPANVMYPVVDTQTTLGAGDANGIRTFTKACAS